MHPSLCGLSLVLITVFIVHGAQGLMCYKCPDKSMSLEHNLHCTEPGFDLGLPKLCRTHNHTWCMTRTQTGGAQTRTMRSCVWKDPASTSVTPGCRQEYGLEVCYCNKDGCNGGGNGADAAFASRVSALAAVSISFVLAAVIA